MCVHEQIKHSSIMQNLFITRATGCVGSAIGRQVAENRSTFLCKGKIINPSIEIRYGVKDYYPHQPMHIVADISELTIDTGWQPKTSFEEGIRAFV